MEQELTNNAELDAAFEKAKAESLGLPICVAHMSSLPDPLSPSNQDELKYIWKIKRTIEICEEMLNPKQFVSGRLNFILFDLTRIESSGGFISGLVPNVISPYIHRYPKIDSGFLWHVTFGRKGYPIWGGTINDPWEGQLDIDGFLVSHPDYAGIIFVSQFGALFGFYNSDYKCCEFDSRHSKMILSVITDGKINNEKNSHGYGVIANMISEAGV